MALQLFAGSLHLLHLWQVEGHALEAGHLILVDPLRGEEGLIVELP